MCNSTILWEALVMFRSESKIQSDKDHVSQLLRELGRTACMSYQEIGIDADERGWIIHINACNETGKVDILIPIDRNKPVEILLDTRAQSGTHRNY